MRRCWSKGSNFQLAGLSPGDLMYSTVITVDSIVYTYLEVVKRVDLKCYYYQKMVINVRRWRC